LVVTRRRAVEEVEFDPPGNEVVVERMDQLAAAHDGWINLLPGVPDDEVEQRQPGMLSALFGASQPPVSMCTWVPGPAPAGRAQTRRRRRDAETVGIMHPRGRFASTQLVSLGAPVPAGWTVKQDHARRGIIVAPVPGAPHAAVLEWTLAAGAALAAVPLTGRWKARVYLPR
jgi:hypothetical protein